MRIGFGLPHTGPAAGPDAIIRVARRAEELGYDSLWVYDRFLFPLEPQVPYGGTPDGSYPEVFKRVLDPVGSLMFAAAHTSRIALGTSVLDMPYYNPVLLARSLTTLDVLSGGRLRVGLGLGWCKDEFDAVGRPMQDLGRYADEFVAVLKAIWTTDPAEFHGHFFTLPRSIIQPKPVQKPHPPIYLGAFTAGALKRAATVSDGWNSVFLPVDAMRQMAESLKTMAREAGRDPTQVQIVVRANIHRTREALAGERPAFSGDREQIRADVQATEQLGADEIFFDPAFSPDGASLEAYLEVMEELRQIP